MKQSLDLPGMIAHCDQCERNTPTKILFMKAGFGKACAICGRLRRGKPYLSKVEFQTLKPDAAKGGIHEAEAL
jgi:hypothetical protein